MEDGRTSSIVLGDMSAEDVHQGARLKMAHSPAALASKARSCADIIRPDIIQANQGAIVAEGAAILE